MAGEIMGEGKNMVAYDSSEIVEQHKINILPPDGLSEDERESLTQKAVEYSERICSMKV